MCFTRERFAQSKSVVSFQRLFYSFKEQDIKWNDSLNLCYANFLLHRYIAN